MDNRKHYLAAISAFVIWGFFSIPLRAVDDYPVGEILFFRIMLSALVLIAIVLVGKKKEFRKNLDFLRTFPLPQRNRVIVLTLSGGVLLIVNWLLFIFVVNSINIKTASFSYMICPVITAVLGFLILQERLSILQWSAVGMCAISCLLIGINSTAELFYSFLTAFVYALYLVSQRKNQGFDRIIILAIQVTFAVFILLFFYSSLISEVPATGKFYGTMFLIATVFTVLPLFLNLYALNRINAATIGILLYLNPIFNFTVALLIFNEVVNLIQIVGYFIIVIALVVFNYPTFRKYQLSIEKRTN
jgi:chloramphenicol-sensitive protein RarD